MMNFLRTFPAVLLALLLVACGGGSDGSPNTPEGNLAVQYSYSNSISAASGIALFSRVDLPAPYTNGMGGNRPHFTLVGGSLPAGFALNADTGVVSGIAREAGYFSPVIRLVVDGFTGSLDQTFNISIRATGISYNIYWGYEPGVYGPTASPFSPPPSTPGLSAVYSIDSGHPLPAGMSIDAATGTISGVPMAVGDFDALAVLTLSYAGSTAISTTTVTISVHATNVAITYPTAGFASVMGTAGSLFDLQVQASQVGSSDTLNNYIVASGALPAGLLLNASTGRITGTPTTSGGASAVIQATLLRESGYTVAVQTTTTFNITTP